MKRIVRMQPRSILKGHLRRKDLIQELARCCLKGARKIDLSFKQKRLLELGLPVQKIIGHTHFDGLFIPLERYVFIPRMETYELLQEAKKIVKKQLKTAKKPLKILDLCSGTGILGLALKKSFQEQVDVTLIDISEEAYLTAREIASREELDVSILKGDLFKPLKEDRCFDLVVSNPPYLLTGTKIPKELNFEPKKALFAGSDGLSFYRRILKEMPPFLNKEHSLLFEISPEVAAFFKDRGWEIIKDINNNERIARLMVGGS